MPRLVGAEALLIVVPVGLAVVVHRPVRVLAEAGAEQAGQGAGDGRARHHLAARKLLGWPKRCKLAHAFLHEYSDKRLKLARLLGQLGVFLA